MTTVYLIQQRKNLHRFRAKEYEKSRYSEVRNRINYWSDYAEAIAMHDPEKEYVVPAQLDNGALRHPQILMKQVPSVLKETG